MSHTHRLRPATEIQAWAPRLALAAGVVSVAAVWIFTHPYVGVSRDAIVYVGRAMADLHPASVARELDYVHDGQSAFSLYPRLLRLVAAALGPGEAALVLSGASLLIWVAAATFLMSGLVRGVRLWAALVCLAVMPADYGFLNVYHYTEVLALPRPLAEAAGLTALGLFIRGRRWAAIPLAVLAALLHPLMALPVLGVLLVLFCLADRRWLILGGVGLVGVLAAAAAGAPIVGRLFQSFDPTWRAVIALRTPPVFVTQWTEASWGLLACQMATVTVAGLTADRGARPLRLAVAGVAAFGVAITLAPSILIAQLQPWRAQWLLAAMAAASAPGLVEALWRRGPVGRLAIALLAAAWLCRDSAWIAIAAGLAALGATRLPPDRPMSRLVETSIWALLAGLAIATEGARAAAYLAELGGAARFPVSTLLAAGMVGLPAAAAATIAALAWRDCLGVRFAAPALGASVLALAAAAAVWDDRPPFTRWEETLSASPPLAPLMGTDFVYWLGDHGVNWLITGAPEWWSTFQGAGVVFDRGQAMDWSRRRQLAKAAGLYSQPGQLAHVTRPGLARLCADADGPRWLVAPVAAVNDAALLRQARIWRAGAPERLRAAPSKTMIEVRDYALFDCAIVTGGPRPS